MPAQRPTRWCSTPRSAITTGMYGPAPRHRCVRRKIWQEVPTALCAVSQSRKTAGTIRAWTWICRGSRTLWILSRSQDITPTITGTTSEVRTVRCSATTCRLSGNCVVISICRGVTTESGSPLHTSIRSDGRTTRLSPHMNMITDGSIRIRTITSRT